MAHVGGQLRHQGQGVIEQLRGFGVGEHRLCLERRPVEPGDRFADLVRGSEVGRDDTALAVRSLSPVDDAMQAVAAAAWRARRRAGPIASYAASRSLPWLNSYASSPDSIRIPRRHSSSTPRTSPDISTLPMSPSIAAEHGRPTTAAASSTCVAMMDS